MKTANRNVDLLPTDQSGKGLRKLVAAIQDRLCASGMYNSTLDPLIENLARVTLNVNRLWKIMHKPDYSPTLTSFTAHGDERVYANPVEAMFVSNQHAQLLAIKALGFNAKSGSASGADVDMYNWLNEEAKKVTQ